MKTVGLFLGIEPSAGGMFQYALSLLDALAKLPDVGVKVAYVAPLWAPILASYPFETTQLKGGWLGLRMAEASMVLRVPAALARTVAALANPIPAQLKRLQCDVWIFPAQDALTYQAGVPAIGTVHDLMHRYARGFPEVSAKGRYGIREHRFRNLTESAVGILVDSDVGREQVVESYGFDRDKTYVLPYVPPRYIFAESEPADFSRQYPLPAKFLFYPAQFWAHKNHSRLLEAAAAIRDSCPGIRLVFTGGKDHLYEQIRLRAEALGLEDSVTFVGYISDRYLPGFYRRARGLVMPTFFGPTNIPPLEAFACGCPVAVSNIFGMPQQVGNAALLFDPTSVDDIGRAMKRLWLDDHLCEELRAKGRERTAQWGPDQFSRSLSGILNAVVGHRA